jgi:translation initiation factor IF-2
MYDYKGEAVEDAGPSAPVEVLGLQGLPKAGDSFQVITDDTRARQIAQFRQEQLREIAMAKSSRLTLDQLHLQMSKGDVKEVPIVLKADVQGSAEAVAAALEKLSTTNVGVKVISNGVGGITESDVTLAKASSAVCIGFNVRPAGKAQQTAEQEGVEIKTYQVIYDAIDDVKKAMVGMLAPVEREKLLGKAQVRQIFNMPKVGSIAGCMVLEGKIARRAPARLVRDAVVIYTGKIGSLKRFKDDAAEVDKGYECGLTIDGYQDLKEGDVIESFEIEQIAATLDAPTGDNRVQKET